MRWLGPQAGLCSFLVALAAGVSGSAHASGQQSFQDQVDASAQSLDETIPSDPEDLPCQTCGGGDDGSGVTEPAPVPAEKFATSPGGVDMRSGRYAYKHTDLTIGNDHGLALERFASTQPGQPAFAFGGEFTHNWLITLSSNRVQVPHANIPAQYDHVVTVRYGNRSASFRSHYSPTIGSFRETSTDTYAELSFTGHTISPNLHPYPINIPDYYTMTAEDGTIVRFRNINGHDCDGHGELCAFASEVTEADGTVYNLEYEDIGQSFSDQRLRAVISNHGYALLFEYKVSGYPRNVSAACVISLALYQMPDVSAATVCPAGVPTSSYSYFGGKLSSFIDQSGSSTLADGLSKIYYAGESAPYLANTLNSKGIVTRQSFVDGRRYTYTWDIDPNTVASGDNLPAGGSYVDANGAKVIVKYGIYDDLDGQDITKHITPGPERVTDELIRSISADYCRESGGKCSVSNRQSLTDAEGSIKTFEYDRYRNITRTSVHAKPGSNLGNVVTSATYASSCTLLQLCTKPLSVTDAREHVTDFGYYSHGGAKYELDPANASGVRPGKFYTYVQRYAWIKSGSGFARGSSPVWLLASETTCRMTAINTSNGTCAGGIVDQVKTSYDYGPDNGTAGNTLLLRGTVATAADADGSIRVYRTCYGYDNQGNKIWEASPLAGLASCP